VFLQTNLIEEGSKHIFLEEYSGLLSGALIVVLFIIERIISGKHERKQSQLNWYTSVVILPNLEKIHNFFESYQAEIKVFFAKKSELLKLPTDQLTLAKAREYKLLGEMINSLEFDFLILLMRIDTNLFNKIAREIIPSMNDFVIQALDNNSADQKDLENIFNQISDSKQLLFAELYNQIQHKKY
jgi:hypothetical protein